MFTLEPLYLGLTASLSFNRGVSGTHNRSERSGEEKNLRTENRIVYKNSLNYSAAKIDVIGTLREQSIFRTA
jgi:hypothetical protein